MKMIQANISCLFFCMALLRIFQASKIADLATQNIPLPTDHAENSGQFEQRNFVVILVSPNQFSRISSNPDWFLRFNEKINFIIFFNN